MSNIHQSALAGVLRAAANPVDRVAALARLRWTSGLSLLAALALVLHFAGLAQELGVTLGSRRWLLGLGSLVTLALALAGLLGVSFSPLSARVLAAWSRLDDWLCRARLAALSLIAFSLLALPLAVFGPLGDYLPGALERLALLWFAALAGALGWQALFSGSRAGQLTWGACLALAAMLAALLYSLGTFLPAVSAYPLTLSWSEGSRYYYASLFLAERIYGLDLPPSVLHPSRYLLQAIPFLVDAPLWGHRLWQVLLWIVTPLLASGLVLRRLRPQPALLAALIGLGVYLLLNTVVVYYHLLVTAIIVAAGFDLRRPWRSLTVVLLAGVWAGISRVNWFPMPGMIAAALYMLETPVGRQSFWRYVRAPVVWFGAGLAAALGAQFAYAVLSGNALDQFGSSFTSDLFFYRLFPNPTFPEGLLPMALLASIPALVLGLWGGWRARLHPLRWLGLGGILAVLFGGGLLVSLKIGGGDNLHNLDGYMFILALLAAYTLSGRLADEQHGEALATSGAQRWLAGILLVNLVVVAWFAVQTGGTWVFPDQAVGEQALSEIRRRAGEAAAAGGEVLFMAERHLLALEMVPGVALAPEYERTFIMEMAMSRNELYLAQFRQDLQDKRFALIIVQPLNLVIKGAAESFGEENDAWVTQVSAPLLCYYEPVETLEDASVQFLAPRQQVGECPEPGAE